MSKDQRITLHPKHGVNPAMGTCFWCGQEDGSIILTGAAGAKIPGASKDGEAPRHVVASYDPCDKCREDWSKGVALVEVEQFYGKPPRPYIERTQGLVPTGHLWVVSPDMIRRVFQPESLVAQVLKTGRAFIGADAATKLGLHDPEVIARASGSGEG